MGRFVSKKGTAIMQFTTSRPYSAQATPANQTLPDRFRSLTETILEIREGGGLLSLFGLLFLAAGVFMLLVGLGIVELANANDASEFTLPILNIMGLAFTIVGSVFVFGRTWIRIDRGTGTIKRLKGLVVPLRAENHNLREFQTVVMRHDPGDSDSSEHFPVTLVSATAKDFPLTNPTDYGTACAQAVCVAEFLHIPMEDATTDNVRRMSSGDLRTTLPERLRTAERDYDHSAQPHSMRSKIERLNGELKITVPASSFVLWRLFPSALVIGFAVYAYFASGEFFRHTNTPHEIEMVLWGFLLFFFVALPLLGIIKALLRARLAYSRLTVTSQEVIISEHSILRTRSRRLDITDIVDIDYHRMKLNLSPDGRLSRSAVSGMKPGTSPNVTIPPVLVKILSYVGKFAVSRGILIKSRKGVYAFGAGLPDEEVAWLTGRLREWLRDH